MKILSIIDTLLHGGAETILVNLITGMPQHQHKVIHFTNFFSSFPSHYLLQKLKDNHVKIIDIDYNSLSEQKVQKEIFNTFPADIILYHEWGNDPLASWRDNNRKNGLNNPKFICVIHRTNPEGVIPDGYDYYVSVSKFILASYKQIPDGKKKVIYNGIDSERFDVSRHRRQDDRFVIGRVSNLSEVKIPSDWVKVLSKLNIDNAYFVIAGEGPRRKTLLDDVRALNLEGKFSFPGYVHQDELPRLLSSFDICCYATDRYSGESHSLSLLECSVAGLPIIAQPRGGIPEQVIHGETGFLSEDVEGMMYYCKLLARDPILLKRMSAQAREFGMQFNINRMCREYEELFTQLISNEKN